MEWAEAGKVKGLEFRRRYEMKDLMLLHAVWYYDGD